MDKPDYQPFMTMLDAVYALHGKSLNAEAKALFFRAMAQFPLSTVRAALDAHVRDPQRGQYPPKPADLMAQLQGVATNDGRPGPDEAWAIALTSRDEAETVVWTQEAAEAFGICRPVLDEGDEVGARMAFKDAYTRLVTEARKARKPCEWIASLGWDEAKRHAAVASAVERNLLPAPAVSALLPPPPAGDGYDARKAAQNLAKVRQMMAGMTTPAEKRRQAREAANAARRATTTATKAAIAERVREYQGAHA